MGEKLFKKAYAFDSDALGRNKQSFAVARHLADSFEMVVGSESVKCNYTDGKILLVSCGTGSSSMEAVMLKRRAPDKFFAIQLMDPNQGNDLFDLVVSPAFEAKYHISGSKNCLEVVCMPSDDEVDADPKILKSWSSFFEQFNGKLTVVMVGGSSQFVSITKDEYEEMCSKLCARAKSAGNRLLFITSPRTDRGFLKLAADICKNERVPHGICDWKKGQGNGVVQAVLKEDLDMVVTGDSCSMISEVVLAGKGVSIARNGGFGSERYTRLHSELLDQNLAVDLSSGILSTEIESKACLLDALTQIERYVSKELEKGSLPLRP